MLKKGHGDETDNKKVIEFVPYKTAPKNQNHHIIPDIYGPSNVKYSGFTDRAHGKFFECAESSVMEFDLHQFSSWYRTLCFAKAFNNPLRPAAIDEGFYRFHFKVWILNPRYAELNPKQELKNKSKLEWGQSLATTFYKRVFATNPNDLRSVEHAVQNDWTVLILTTKLPSQMDPPKSFEGLRRRTIVLVVGAVTFREGRLPVSTSVRPALISWLAVADFYYHNEGGPGPSALGLNSWRRQGFALFLIIHVIKRCSVVKGGYVGDFPIPVAVYLQCTVKLAVQFYMSCGFVRINNKDKDDDGFDCLPESLQQALLERAPPCLFIKYDHSNGHPPCRLMMLRPGSLRQPNTDESIILEESNDVIVLTDSDAGDANNDQQDWERVWCQYPSPKRGCKHTRYIISGSQMREAHENLNELNNLLPLPARPLLPHGALRIHGFVRTSRRVKHSKKEGTKWLDIGEIDMMLALLLRDGRYDDSATILPMAYAQTIAAGFDAHVRYVEMLELENQTTKKFIDKNMAVPPNATETAIMEKFGTSADVIHNSFHCAINNVIEKIIAPSPGILAKRLIVIPQRMNNNHWVATFVFNASNIGRSSEDDNNNDIIEFPEDVTAACFYRYCPLGKKAFPEAFGTRWFLNLAYSYMKHMEQQRNTSLDLVGGINSKDSIQDMEWLYPFGNHLRGYHKGTKVFPHLRFDKTDSLPLQQDGYNCGVGVVAAVGIILRDIIGSTLESENRFYNIFEQSQLSLTLEGNGLWREWVVKLQAKLLKPLPSPAHLVWGDYLSILRSQWFVLFDRLAELQNVTIPNHGENPPLWYVNVRRQLEWPDNIFNMTRRPPAKKNAPYTEDKQTDAAVRSLMCLGSMTKLGHKPDDDGQTSNKELLVDRHVSDDNDGKTTPQTPRQKRKRNVRDKNPDKKVVENITSSEVIESLSDVNVLSSKLIRAQDSQTQLVLSVGGKHSLRKQPKRDYTETFVQLKTRSEKQKVQERFMRWWRKEKEEAKTVMNNVVDSHQGTKSIPTGVVTRGQFVVSPKSVLAYSKYIASISQTTPDHKNVWQEPLVDIESREAFVQRSFKSWDWHDEDEFLRELQRRRKLAEGASCRKEKFFHFAIHRAMKKERRFYRQQLEAEYMCSVDACLESVKYEHETGRFTGRFSYKTLTDVNSEDEVYNHTDMLEVVPDVVYHNTDMPVDEQWVRRAFSKEVVDQIMSFDSGNADGFVPVPQTARNVAPTRINHLPIVRVCYVHPTVRCVPNIDCETEVTGSSWSNKKFLPVSGYWKGRHANGSTIRVEEKELRSKFGDAYVDQVKNMRCGFMDIPVGEYKVSQLHKYPHLRVLGAPTLKYIQCGGKDLCASKSLASALYRLGFLQEAAIINDFGERHLEENLTETIKRLRLKVSTVLPSWIQPKVMPLGFNWESDLDDRTIFVGVLLASDGHCNHAVTIHGKWVYDANETIALPLMRDTLDYCTSTETRKSKFRGFWRGVLFQYIGTKKERISRLTVLPP